MSKTSSKRTTVSSPSRVFKGKSGMEVAAAFGSPALSDASSDEQISRAISISRKSAPRTPPASHGRRGFQEMSEYEAAAAYGTPALSDASSDEQSLLSDKTRWPAPSRAYSYASSSRDATLLGSASGSSTPRSHHPSHHAMSPTPTPRYAADEIIARNLARSLNVASIQGDLVDDPAYVRPTVAPPLVVRAPSPAASVRSVASSQRTMYQSPNGALSPLLLPTRYLDTQSIRSMDSVSSLRSAASVQSSASTRSSASIRSVSSVSTVRSTSSISSLLSNVTRSSRHEPLDSAARALRASLPPSLARSPSSVSTKLSRASTIRSIASTLSARGITAPEKHALEKLRALAMSPVRCTRPGCSTLIPPTPLDNITFPIVFRADASPPRSLFNALHACCPACSQNHCRACSLPTGCAAGCSGDAGWNASGALVPVKQTQTPKNAVYPPPPCPVPTHCAAARALGFLAALIAFDRAHIAMGASDHGRAADRPLIGELQTLVFFLSPPSLGREASPLISEALASDPALAALVGLSRVPAYAASLLRVGAGGTRGEPDVGTWMARAPAYGAVLRLLRALGDAGCQSVLSRPIRAGAGAEAWFRRGAGGSDVWREDGGSETLRVLIRRLEASRAALLRLAGVTTFKPTVEKAHALCDGILYLLLQDVLGEEEEG